MKLLLDTHIFLWYITADSRLSTLFRDAIREPKNEIFLSVISLWEVIIKYNLANFLYLNRPKSTFRTNADGIILKLFHYTKTPSENRQICPRFTAILLTVF